MKKIKISEDLLKVKDLVGRSGQIRLRNAGDEVLTQLKELGYRVDKLEKNPKKMGSSVNLKRKKQILFLLKEKTMTSADIGKVLKLSRNRANEYLKAMEKEGIIKGLIRERKRYYSVKVSK